MPDFKKLVAEYCNEYGITETQMKRVYGNTGRLKLVGHTHVDRMRMCLAHYIRSQSTYSLTQIAGLVGYKCHSTICQNHGRMEHYVKVKDPALWPYYEKLLEVAQK